MKNVILFIIVLLTLNSCVSYNIKTEDYKMRNITEIKVRRYFFANDLSGTNIFEKDIFFSVNDRSSITIFSEIIKEFEPEAIKMHGEYLLQFYSGSKCVKKVYVSGPYIKFQDGRTFRSKIDIEDFIDYLYAQKHNFK